MTIYQKYATLRAQLETLSVQMDEVKKKIIDSIEDKKETEYGIFTPYNVVTYSYSESVQKIAEKLKLAKIREEEKGIAAVKTVTTALRFTPLK